MKKLSLRFVTAGDEISTMSISEVKEDITEAEINDLMDAVVANDIFYTSAGSFTKKKSAKIIDITETEVEIA